MSAIGELGGTSLRGIRVGRRFIVWHWSRSITMVGVYRIPVRTVRSGMGVADLGGSNSRKARTRSTLAGERR